jgi:hypothetical protein
MLSNDCWRMQVSARAAKHLASEEPLVMEARALAQALQVCSLAASAAN